MRHKCDVCGNAFEAKRRDARTCSAACRNNRRRGARPAPENSLVAATRRELAAAGKLDSMLGQQALVLAARLVGSATSGGVGTLSKELSRVTAAAIGSTPSSPAAGKGDDVDELRARRDAKRAG